MTTQRYADTLARLLADTIGKLPPVTIPLHEAVGRRLAAELVTTHPSPGFDNSQMDGYGIGYANIAGGRFRVGPDVPAGREPAELYPYGVNGYGHDTAVPIMTGAKIPDDVVAVIPVEHADPPRFVETGQYVQLPAVEVGANVRKTGSDMPARTVLAREGSVVNAALIGAAATQGIGQLTVRALPSIAVVAGGDEVAGDTAPLAAQIFDANTPLIQGLAGSHGLHVVATVKITDDVRTFQQQLADLVRDHRPDIIITSGGISEGKYEVIRQLLEQLNVSWVGKIRQQPGGPQGYGVYGTTPLIALPGNPISTLVSMRMVVLPALWEAFEAGWQPMTVQARINSPVTGLRDKVQYRRGIVGSHGTELLAQVHGDIGSHLISQAVGANALLEIPPLARLKPGQIITAHLFADADLHQTVEPPTTPAETSSRAQSRVTHAKTAKVLIASTRAAAGIYEDDAGPKIVDWLRSKGFETPAAQVVADSDLGHTVRSLVIDDADAMPDVLITSGGTGISPTDRTVEVIGEMLDMELPHVMTTVLLQGLKNTPYAALSRGIAGVVGETFLATLPGSLGGVRDGIQVLDTLLDHIVEQIRGEDHDR